MSLFGSKKSTCRYGVIIDIGSGSVLTAIVRSDPSKLHPDILWAHREHAPLKNIDSLEQSSKAVMTALMNSAMKVDSEGRAALRNIAPNAKLSELQSGIAAPWSYTVTKTINYNQDSGFTITEELIDELTQAVRNKVSQELSDNESLSQLELQVIAQATLALLANGYQVVSPEGQKAEQFSISSTSAVTQQYLIDSIEELHQKLFAGTESKKLSFMLMLYCVTNDILPKAHDVCLIDITFEATEIGIVRDGILSYSTHVSFGSFSLAREIANITGVTLTEAFGYLHTKIPYSFMETLPVKQKTEVEAVFEGYIVKIENLFHQTGDSLSIPKRIAIHADINSESLFLALIDKAARRAIKTSPQVTCISKEIVEKTYIDSTKNTPAQLPADTALLVSAQFFHKQKNYRSFEYR